MTQSYEQAQAYVYALTGSVDSIIDWRCIHDTNKGVDAHIMRGTLAQVWSDLVQHNNTGWGIFACINAMDGLGRELNNVQYIRAHVVDLDNPMTSADGYKRASAAYPQPHFSVSTSPNKFHLYWLVEPYMSNEFYTLQQRKLAQLYDGDKSIVDPTRVLRVPGFYHLKSQPFLTTCAGLHQGARWPVAALADSLAHINVINHIGMRSRLGDTTMQAPSIEWLTYALNTQDPNELNRSEWLSLSAAFKQAGWNLVDEPELLRIWQTWCARYNKNDGPENLKLWHSIRDTEVGWAAFERRTNVKAHMMFDTLPPTDIPKTPAVEKVSSDNLPTLLEGHNCPEYFKDCYFITRTGEIFTRGGRYLNSTQFNGAFGGKQFLLADGKITDEPWKAALRSTLWTIPKVDHVRFLPDKPSFAVVEDELGRAGLNTYIPVKNRDIPGDPAPWLDWMNRILPHEGDRKIWFDYLAHCIKYPGYKIPWAPLLQTAEGAGKSIFQDLMKYALGQMYVYSPKAEELASSGSKFNAWMRSKLCIIVNEIKVDDRRELIEILKPMITDSCIEIQAKGVDQEMEDNVANWIFFSNFKDAVPISKNGRRYSVFYSHLQTEQDIVDAGMPQSYFDDLFYWLDEQNGYGIVTHWLRNYPIEKGRIPKRAPHSSTHEEALKISRSPLQIAIEDAIEDNLQGFRGGYVSSIAVKKRAEIAGIRSPAAQSIRAVLEGMGFTDIGRALSPYSFEDANARAVIYANRPELTLENYAQAQGYIVSI